MLLIAEKFNKYHLIEALRRFFHLIVLISMPKRVLPVISGTHVTPQMESNFNGGMFSFRIICLSLVCWMINLNF